MICMRVLFYATFIRGLVKYIIIVPPLTRKLWHQIYLIGCFYDFMTNSALGLHFTEFIMKSYHYRRLPVSACSLSPQKLGRNPPIILNVPANRLRRVWMESMKYLSPRDILALTSACKLFYNLSHEPELWHDICLHQVPEFLFAAIESDTYLTVSPVFHLPYKEIEEIIHDNLPYNSDHISEEDENTLMSELEMTVPENYQAAERDLGKVKPDQYRRIAMTALAMECRSCKRFRADVVMCPVLGRYLCIKCRGLTKYRMLSLHGVCKKFGVSKELLDELEVPAVKAPNPRSKNFHDMLLYYDFMVKQQLERQQVPQYLRYKALKHELVSQGLTAGLHLLYGKIFTKYLKDQGVSLEAMVKNLTSRLSRSKVKVTSKQRKPKVRLNSR